MTVMRCNGAAMEDSSCWACLDWIIIIMYSYYRIARYDLLSAAKSAASERLPSVKPKETTLIKLEDQIVAGPVRESDLGRRGWK